MKCVSWILTPPPTSPETLISSWKQLISIKRWSRSTPASKNIVTSLPLSPHWMAWSGSRRMWHLNISPAASRQSGRDHTHIPAVTWRIGLWSLSSRQGTTVSRGAKLRPIKLAQNASSGRTLQAYTSLGKKRSPARPNQLTPSSFLFSFCLDL